MKKLYGGKYIFYFIGIAILSALIMLINKLAFVEIIKNTMILFLTSIIFYQMLSILKLSKNIKVSKVLKIIFYILGTYLFIDSNFINCNSYNVYRFFLIGLLIGISPVLLIKK